MKLAGHDPISRPILLLELIADPSICAAALNREYLVIHTEGSLSTRSAPICAALSAFVLLVLLPQPAAADWPTDPTTNVPLCVADLAQGTPAAAPDGTGGAIVAWDDQRGGPRDIYVQRVDGTGLPRWAGNGVALCTATGDQWVPQLVSDGNGGAIVTWSDHRNGANYDIYVQRVDSSGTPLWTANGVALCTAANFQSHHRIVSDGSGGAIVTWDDARTGNSKIYAQRVNAGGVPQWTPNGVLLTNSLPGQARPIIVSNGAAGAIVAWEDVRNGDYDIVAQRILASGALDPAWPAAGRVIAPLLPGAQEWPAIAADDSGGAVVAWAQWDGGGRVIRVHHLRATGALDPAWPVSGRTLSTGFFDDQANPAIVPAGAGGVLVSWDDNRNSTRDIYAQHVLPTGVIDPVWPAAGCALGLLVSPNFKWPRMVPDGARGAIVTWEDERNDEGDIFAQHVTIGGAVDPAWPAAGRAVCTAGRFQVLPAIVSDGAGGAVIAWDDHRNGFGGYGEDDDIYVQHVRGNGQLGEDPLDVSAGGGPGLALESPIPNPTRTGAMIVRFTLPTDATASLELFDVAGRRIIARDVGALGAGLHAVDLTAGRRPAAGIYFVRLRQGDGARAQRIIVLDE
jgi:hypothetical protein